MPHRKVNGANIYYEEHGSGPETIVFSHGFLWSGYMFHNQVDAMKDRNRCITFDHRGQGKSEITESGYDIDNVYKDAVALIEALECAPCHFVGLSMGGFVGLRIGIRRPELIKTLTLIESSSNPQSKDSVGRYRLLGFVARWIGLRVIVNPVMEIMFGHKFRNDSKRIDLKRKWEKHLLSNDRVGIIRALSGVINRQGVTEQLGQINTPTLIIVGDQDTALPLEESQTMHVGIPNSRLVVIPGAGHTSTVEEPVAVTAAMTDFLDSQVD